MEESSTGRAHPTTEKLHGREARKHKRTIAIKADTLPTQCSILGQRLALLIHHPSELTTAQISCHHGSDVSDDYGSDVSDDYGSDMSDDYGSGDDHARGSTHRACRRN